jgi:hypothetical protein
MTPLIVILGMAFLSWLVMLSAQAYVGFKRPVINASGRSNRFPRLRLFAVNNNKLLGFAYFFTSNLSLIIFSFSNNVQLIVISSIMLVIAVFFLIIRVLWSFF